LRNTILVFASSGFTPSLTPECAAPLAQLVYNLDPAGCGLTLYDVLTDSNMVTQCTTGGNGYNCMDPGSVYSSGLKAKDIVPVYRLPTSASPCSLCTASSGMKSGCDNLLVTTVNAAYGVAPDYSSYGITNQTLIAQCNDLVLQASSNCKHPPSNLPTLQILRYQSELLCASTNTFGMPIAPAGNIDGIVDMRSLTQCGTCAVIPCLPGQLCNGNGKAMMCPEGYYCPNPAQQFKCPKDYFCPQGSTSPKECRSVATGSCSEGVGREVVWVPLFIAGIILIFIFYLEILIDYFFYFYLTKRPSSAAGSPISPAPSGSQQAHHRFQKVSLNEQFSFSTTSSLVEIQFEKLMLVTNNTTRINQVSGRIRPGKFTAIIGGSGAGKTSLMNVILGREAKTAGEISYLSKDYHATKKIPSKLLDRIIAFVPQNDIYLREMTVYELIEHSARWRLPSFFTNEQIYQRIDEVLVQLQLEHLKDITVGGFSTSVYSNQKPAKVKRTASPQLKPDEGKDAKAISSAVSSSITLSPGDRKKVNIALELVANPNILFLDEPTTGIDSSSALNVAKIVSNLAKTGMTCVAVIHQPRTEIFSLIDDMIILQSGGRVAYQGSTKYVIQYFEEHGFHLTNPKANKTDFLIDIISKPPPKEVFSVVEEHDSSSNEVQQFNKTKVEQIGEGQEVFHVVGEGVEANPTVVLGKEEVQASNNSSSKRTWADLWERDGLNFIQRMEKLDLVQVSAVHDKSKDVVYPIHDKNNAANDVEEARNSVQNHSPDNSKKIFIPLDIARRGFFEQLYLFFRRGFQQHFKNNIYKNDLIIHFIAGIIMGIVTCGGPLYVGAIPYTYNGSCPPGAEIRCNSWIRFEIAPATFLLAMILGSVIIPGAVRTFGREKEVFQRESNVGANKLAYFVGKILSDLPFMVVNTFVYMAPIIAIAPWQSPVDKFYGVLLCLSLVVLGLGYWLSFIFVDPDAAVLTGVILAILLNLFSGFVPTIGDGPIGLIMYTHWSARAVTTTELFYGQGVTNVEDFNTVVPDAWKDPDLGNDCGVLILISVILCVCAYVTLLYRNKRVGKMD
jgi:ABC-type multidrug transport system ATPase subunit